MFVNLWTKKILCLVFFIFLQVIMSYPVDAGKNPFGVGVSEPNIAPSEGVFRGFFAWVAMQQSIFYHELTEALRVISNNGSALWGLIGLSFLYGIFHAAGPGHGKAVISSYVLANRETARRGILLAFISAMIQAIVAVVLIGIAAAILDVTSRTITKTVFVFEVGSYALITILGAVLIWSKGVKPFLTDSRQHVHLTEDGRTLQSHCGHQHDHCHHPGHEGCGCGHVVDARQAEQAKSFKKAIMAVLSVGIRPCSGALIVLVFALSQGLFFAGVWATFAMGLGTAITVSILVLFAVGAKDVALRLSGRESRFGRSLFRLIEVAGAVFIFAIGSILLITSLSHSGVV